MQRAVEVAIIPSIPIAMTCSELDTKVGFDVNLTSFFSSVTNLTSTLYLRFSIVFPNTLLFISLKKSFSKLFLALVLLRVLKSMYCFSHGD